MHNYLVTLPLLQFLIKNGVEVATMHKVIKFKQGFYLKEFIDDNIKMRAAATNPFIKNALKLINNAIYGRTLLNPLNYVTQAKIYHDENDSNLLRSFSKPTFRKVDVINDDRFLVTYKRTSVKATSRDLRSSTAGPRLMRSTILPCTIVRVKFRPTWTGSVVCQLVLLHQKMLCCMFRWILKRKLAG